jgi:glucose/arabinose dehydrogenase
MAFPVFLKHSERATARKARRLRASLFAAVLCSATAVAVEPEAAPGWSYAVVADGLPAVDNLAFADDGALYATLELKGEGRLVRLDAGRPHTVLGGLDRPDGLRIRGHRAYLAEEVINGRILEVELASGKARTLARLQAPEGIAVLADGDLLVTEDRPNGRLVRVRRDGATETVMVSLQRPEGIAASGNGVIHIAETATGRVLTLRDGERTVTVEGLNEPDQLALATDGALWITEDAQPGRLLRFIDGRLETVLSGLAFPQGIAVKPDGGVMVAEQGRARVLAVMRRETAP